MDYEKKYKEALERARKLKENPKAIFFEEKNVHVSDYIFPELKESEDERVRKRMIDFFTDWHRTKSHCFGISVPRILAWLEKSGEQKLFDCESVQQKEFALKIEPKDYSDIDPYFFKPTDKVKPKSQGKSAVEAAKEQRDLLFAKMKEAGYEWDTEKKELKKKIDNEIEIPFGAEDSELQEATYFIPKGFHAEIDDDKVVIKKGEKPTAWSEEDEKNIACYNPYKEVVESIAEMCKHYDKASHSGLRDFYDNVKVKCKDAKEYDSLFPQSTWKPSDEQMEALDDFIYAKYPNIEKYGAAVKSLYQDLKKLMEK